VIVQPRSRPRWRLIAFVMIVFILGGVAIAIAASSSDHSDAKTTSSNANGGAVTTYENAQHHYRLRFEVIHPNASSAGDLDTRVTMTNTGSTPLFIGGDCSPLEYTVLVTGSDHQRYTLPSYSMLMPCGSENAFTLQAGEHRSFERPASIATNEPEPPPAQQSCRQGPGAGTYRMRLQSTSDLLGLPPLGSNVSTHTPIQWGKLAAIEIRITPTNLDGLPACGGAAAGGPQVRTTGSIPITNTKFAPNPSVPADQPDPSVPLVITDSVRPARVAQNGAIRTTVTVSNPTSRLTVFGADCNANESLAFFVHGHRVGLTVVMMAMACSHSVPGGTSFTDAQDWDLTTMSQLPNSDQTLCKLPAGTVTIEYQHPSVADGFPWIAPKPLTFTVTEVRSDTRPVCPTS
jgi:hypothetical protein